MDQDEAARNLVGELDRAPSERSQSKLVFLIQCRSGRAPGGISGSHWGIPMGIDNESDQVP